MIKLINRTTGTAMWVADNRVNDYLAKGHKLAPVPGGKPEKATAEELAAAKKKVTRKK